MVEKIVIPVLIIFFAAGADGITVTGPDFDAVQQDIGRLDTGDRIAFWAEKFIGAPYDIDPLGAYVRQRVIVFDEYVDCMYLTFRVVELALSTSYRETITNALHLRFKTGGKIDGTGRVLNYEDRFRYGIDMIRSGKWGRVISSSVSKTIPIKGARGIDTVEVIDTASAITSAEKLRNGDIVFFVKDPLKRKVGEIVGHIGIVSVCDKVTFLIHAGGLKNKNGIVTKTALKHYLDTMPFVGIIVTRFD